MSQFNVYARRLDDAAKRIFGEYRRAEAAFKAAQTAKDRGPRRGRLQDAYTAAKINRLDADYLEAKAAYDKLRKEMPDRGEHELRTIRAELEKDLDTAFTADPAQVDIAALELMKSGICTAADYEKLLADADNVTMKRLIASYASKAADSLRDKSGKIPFDQQEWARLDNVSRQTQSFTTRAVLETYDALSDVFARAMKNPGMIDHWDELTGCVVENF